MAKHEVTCLKCGRRFDANEGGSYLPEANKIRRRVAASA